MNGISKIEQARNDFIEYPKLRHHSHRGTLVAPASLPLLGDQFESSLEATKEKKEASLGYSSSHLSRRTPIKNWLMQIFNFFLNLIPWRKRMNLGVAKQLNSPISTRGPLNSRDSSRPDLLQSKGMSASTTQTFATSQSQAGIKPSSKISLGDCFRSLSKFRDLVHPPTSPIVVIRGSVNESFDEWNKSEKNAKHFHIVVDALSVAQSDLLRRWETSRLKPGMMDTYSAYEIEQEVTDCIEKLCKVIIEMSDRIVERFDRSNEIYVQRTPTKKNLELFQVSIGSILRDVDMLSRRIQTISKFLQKRELMNLLMQVEQAKTRGTDLLLARRKEYSTAQALPIINQLTDFAVRILEEERQDRVAQISEQAKDLFTEITDDIFLEDSDRATLETELNNVHAVVAAKNERLTT